MKTVKLGEIAELTVGFVGSMTEQYVDKGVPFLRSLNIKPFEINNDDIRYISDEFNKKIKKSILHSGDVVIVRTGAPGTCCVVPDEYDGCNCSDVVIVRPNTEQVDPLYLAGFVNFWGQKQISNNKVGAIQQHFNVRIAEEMLIMLPDLDEQRKIGKVLGNLNTKISANKAINDNLYACMKTEYEQYFIQFNFPYNGKPYSQFGGKMKWSETLGRDIPEKWHVAPLHEVADLQYGYPLSTDYFGNDGTPVIRIRDIEGNDFSARTTEPVDNCYLTQPQDLLIGMDGNFQMNFWHKQGYLVNQRITRIRKKSFPVMLIKFQIEPYISAKSQNVARSTVGHLSDDDIKGLQILIPSEEFDFTGFDDALSIIIRNINENDRLIQLRDWLLPMLMNGQASISD